MEPLHSLPQSESLPLVVPPVRSPKPGPVSERHDCQFYENEAFLCEAVARFLGDGLRAGQPVILVATGPHRSDIAQVLGEAGLDFDAAVATGQLTYADARATLERFMDGETPDREHFRATLGGIIRASLGRPFQGTLRIFGEMVDLLWRDGNPSGALRLEQLWNELAESHEFELLCGYSMGNFYTAEHADHFDEVCAMHARAIPTEVIVLKADQAAREREISLLQQRARSLESELDHRRQLEVALRQALGERARAEEAMLEAKDRAETAARAKSEFLALMGHELRTPLNSILGYQDLLEHGVGGTISGEQRAYLSRMRSCSQQLLRLIDQVLNLSQLEASKIQLDTDLVSAMGIARETAALVEPAANRRGLTLEVEGPGQDATVITDGGTLRQILINLLNNAIKFTHAGTVRLAVRRTEHTVTFQVSDTGIGIRAQDLNRIFEPFVQVETVATRRQGGSGLGLAVSRDLARLLGGGLSVTSEIGVGSTFELTLPLTAPASA